jgi:hypothetical protein
MTIVLEAIAVGRLSSINALSGIGPAFRFQSHGEAMRQCGWRAGVKSWRGKRTSVA